MEYNKEEIIKEFKDWSKFKVQGVWKDSIEKLLLEFIEQRLVKKLTLTDVVPQLVEFADWLQYNGKWSLPEQQVKDFIKEQQEQN